jgi:hypothetical protein
MARIEGSTPRPSLTVDAQGRARFRLTKPPAVSPVGRAPGARFPFVSRIREPTL